MSNPRGRFSDVSVSQTASQHKAQTLTSAPKTRQRPPRETQRSPSTQISGQIDDRPASESQTQRPVSRNPGRASVQERCNVLLFHGAFTFTNRTNPPRSRKVTANCFPESQIAPVANMVVMVALTNSSACAASETIAGFADICEA